jgi:hypothetical protein
MGTQRRGSGLATARTVELVGGVATAQIFMGLLGPRDTPHAGLRGHSYLID